MRIDAATAWKVFVERNVRLSDMPQWILEEVGVPKGTKGSAQEYAKKTAKGGASASTSGGGSAAVSLPQPFAHLTRSTKGSGASTADSVQSGRERASGFVGVVVRPASVTMIARD